MSIELDLPSGVSIEMRPFPFATRTRDGYSSRARITEISDRDRELLIVLAGAG